MSERIIFNHEEATRFIVGTIGIPGERAFFIQVNSVFGRTTVAVEKSQVVALEERLREFIGKNKDRDPAQFHLEFRLAMDKFSKKVPFHDDLTLLSLQFSRA